MQGQKILVVEDEEDILELVTYNLQKESFDVTGVESGQQALDSLSANTFDLVLLDLMLPDLSGFEICKKIKNDPYTSSIPVIMLTARGEEEDIVKGLRYGADDYVTKPFSPKVLIERIKTVLRRGKKISFKEDSIIKAHDLTIHTGIHQVLINEEKIDLTNTEFKILHFLVSQPGWVFTRYQIIDAIKGTEYAVSDRSIDFLIAGLRKKLGSCSNYIETVRGVGYRFKEL